LHIEALTLWPLVTLVTTQTMVQSQVANIHTLFGCKFLGNLKMKFKKGQVGT